MVQAVHVVIECVRTMVNGNRVVSEVSVNTRCACTVREAFADNGGLSSVTMFVRRLSEHYAAGGMEDEP